ncbi:hypothetical protein RchiOBHm_Chr4g0408101 [Rosa chinensis]|uniref:Secretory carrier-associated membrane protein n=1 Tax=Rosa chinensis TaxID=74649 RepID=A0A2P6QUS9_ROSCH|nr:hypothetical protein RchiOBHm_Chr4g0408101 [Rosa chinensis]
MAFASWLVLSVPNIFPCNHLCFTWNTTLICAVSYVLWYRTLYRAMRTDSALKFGWCFLFYTGILAAIDVFPDHAVVGGIKFLKRNISIVHLF